MTFLPKMGSAAALLALLALPFAADGQVGSVPQARFAVVGGTALPCIAAVTNDTVTVLTGHGKTCYKVTEFTKITLDGSSATIGDLTKGMKCSVVTTPDNTLDEIDAKSKKQNAGSNTKPAP